MEPEGNLRLIRDWETGFMQEEGGCCRGDGEAGAHEPNTPMLRQRQTATQRMAPFLFVAFLLLISVVVTLLITAMVEGRSQQTAERQLMMQDSETSVERQQQKDFRNPSAMLTAPKGNNIDGDFLEWESEDGNAFCHGGFNYSRGNLVVPRAGIYRVFLQITYESKEDVCNELTLTLFNQVLFIRDTYNDNVPLLSSVDTVSCSMEQWFKSLYTAGLFSLEANCRLRVISSHPGLIVKREHQVFFGAELLPQESDS